MIDLPNLLARGGLPSLDFPDAVERLEVTGADPIFATAFPVGELAATALAGGGVAAARLWRLRGGDPQSVAVDVGAAAASLLGFVLQSQPGGREDVPLARLTTATTALYECGDGRFIHLHGGFPHLHEGTLALLGCAADADSIAAAVRTWKAADLEQALADRRLCGALVRTPEEWSDHPQGRALAALSAIEIERIGEAPVEPLPRGTRPLSGVRNLDLTRVLAGPTSGRTLASYGADVLRVASPHLPSIPPFVIETGHGKRSAFLDLRRTADVERLRELARSADVFTDGYRNGALAQRGFGAEALAELRPGIVVVALSCYGDVGPWATRAGWEQLAQSASGIAHLQGGQGGDGRPQLLPAAVTDYTTGYLAAWGAMEALRRRATEGGSWLVRVSLCQSAQWLLRLGVDRDPASATGLPSPAALQITSETPYGSITHLAPAVQLSRTPVFWERPTVPLGHNPPEWLPHTD